jgi:NAD(P)-dependent dehydrogenase (short-subunit alcohol dehydrogenase family)
MSSVCALAGKIALVTGGSAGIGRATAEALARVGAKVVVCARGKAGLEDTVNRAADSGLIIEAFRTDVGRPEEVDLLFHAVQQTHGRLDILVNAAGILGPLGHLLDISSEKWDEVMRISLTGSFFTCRAAARIMMTQQSGCMINISSGVGRRGRPGWGPYAVSKFGVEGLTQTFGAELAPNGIFVFAVNPGHTRTRMRALACPDENPALLKTPDAVAEILVRRVIPGARDYAGQSLDLHDLIIENRV